VLQTGLISEPVLFQKQFDADDPDNDKFSSPSSKHDNNYSKNDDFESDAESDTKTLEGLPLNWGDEKPKKSISAMPMMIIANPIGFNDSDAVKTQQEEDMLRSSYKSIKITGNVTKVDRDKINGLEEAPETVAFRKEVDRMVKEVQDEERVKESRKGGTGVEARKDSEDVVENSGRLAFECGDSADEDTKA
jgi:hypothetical protein